MPTDDTSQEVLPSADENEAAAIMVPINQVPPVVRRDGLGAQISALAHYMVQTEIHTYAFSVAANVILSLFPFIVMMLTISRRVFHSRMMEKVVGQMMGNFLPTSQELIMKNMEKLAHPHKGTQVFSIVMLLVSSTGVFLPLEVALNQVWGVSKNRSYIRNQIVSLGLAFAVGVLAMTSVALTTATSIALTTGQSWLTSCLNFIHFHIHSDNIVFSTLYGIIYGGVLRILATCVSILIFFLIYWVLPNRKVPARAVLPTAIVVGLLWEGAKYLYILALPHLDFPSVYGMFQISVTLMMWAFLSGLLLLAGAHFSATRYALAVARDEAMRSAYIQEPSDEE